MNEYLNVIRTHYADFSGRARRREYWMFMLFNAIISIILYLLMIPFLLQLSSSQTTGEIAAPSGLALVGLLLFVIYSLAVLIPSLAVSVRRLHDTGKSGWWYLLSLVPFGGLVLLIFFVLDSEPGANKWGPNPKGIGGAVGNTQAGGADW